MLRHRAATVGTSSSSSVCCVFVRASVSVCVCVCSCSLFTSAYEKKNDQNDSKSIPLPALVPLQIL